MGMKGASRCGILGRAGRILGEFLLKPAIMRAPLPAQAVGTGSKNCLDDTKEWRWAKEEAGEEDDRQTYQYSSYDFADDENDDVILDEVGRRR